MIQLCCSVDTVLIGSIVVRVACSVTAVVWAITVWDVGLMFSVDSGSTDGGLSVFSSKGKSHSDSCDAMVDKCLVLLLVWTPVIIVTLM